MKVTWFTKYSRLGPSSRYRVFQFEEHFRNAGVEFESQVLFDDRYFEILRSSRALFRKPSYVLSRFWERYRFLRRCRADLILIEQQLFPYLPFALEKRWMPDRFVVEFDDAVFLTHPGKLPLVLRRAAAVITGNAFLQKYALRYNRTVHLVPTVLDLNRYRPERTESAKIRLGWSGLEYNFKYLRSLVPVLAPILAKYPVELIILSGSPPRDLPVPFRFVLWNPETEVDQLNEFDIGIMPLENDDWCRGKCGMKLLQYMALEVPGVASAVGVNSEIIRHGENGFTANTPEEWRACLTSLIEDAALRQRLGKAGRETVERDYSLERWFPRILAIYRQIAGGQVDQE